MANTSKIIEKITTTLWSQFGDAVDPQLIAEKAREIYSGKRKVLVFGCSGTGKTSLIKSLGDHGAAADKIDLKWRTQRTSPSKFILDGTRFAMIDTAGGQDAEDMLKEAAAPLRDPDRGMFSKISGMFNKIKGIGIINVVSYGYHEYSEEARTAFVTPSSAISQIALNKHREKEINALREWASRISATDVHIDWVMTAVNKADLWPERWSVVQGHYLNGEYQRTLKQYLGNSANFAIAPYCSTLKRFYDVLPMSGTLEESERREMNSVFLSNLVEAVADKPVR